MVQRTKRYGLVDSYFGLVGPHQCSVAHLLSLSGPCQGAFLFFHLHYGYKFLSLPGPMFFLASHELHSHLALVLCKGICPFKNTGFLLAELKLNRWLRISHIITIILYLFSCRYIYTLEYFLLCNLFLYNVNVFLSFYLLVIRRTRVRRSTPRILTIMVNFLDERYVYSTTPFERSPLSTISIHVIPLYKGMDAFTFLCTPHMLTQPVTAHIQAYLQSHVTFQGRAPTAQPCSRRRDVGN